MLFSASTTRPGPRGPFDDAGPNAVLANLIRPGRLSQGIESDARLAFARSKPSSSKRMKALDNPARPDSE